MKKLIRLVTFLFVIVSALPAITWADETQADSVPIININEAELSELVQLKGIGEAKAEAILAWREEHGPFKSVEDLLEVNGIGEATLEAIREQIRLE